ncbi:hypothetical protein AAVH_36589 [Aphelenchoides avenae]|nr:hypothetical protein AAVH_36589 [Aphelenchus avenae]
MHTLQDHLHRFDDDFYSLLRHDITSTTLAEKFLVAWSLFETALATLHNGGQHRGRFHFVDHHYKDLTDSGLVNFFGPDLQMRDLPTVVSFCKERYLGFMEFARSLERLCLDDVEQTAFMQLLFAQCCKRDVNHTTMALFRSVPQVFSSMESRGKFINNALAELHKHYDSTYQDYMGRLSSLLGLIGPFLEVKQSFEEMGIFVALHSRRPQRADVFCINHVCFNSNAS